MYRSIRWKIARIQPEHNFMTVLYKKKMIHSFHWEKNNRLAFKRAHKKWCEDGIRPILAIQIQ